MADKTVREIVIKVTYDPGSGSIETSMQCKDVSVNIMWEALKNHVITMTKTAPWAPDPEEREILIHAAHGMKLMMLGVDQAVAQVKERRKNQNKELSGGSP